MVGGAWSRQRMCWSGRCRRRLGRERKAVLELLERVESVAESVDVEWCRGLVECSERS